MVTLKRGESTTEKDTIGKRRRKSSENERERGSLYASVGASSDQRVGVILAPVTGQHFPASPTTHHRRAAPLRRVPHQNSPVG